MIRIILSLSMLMALVAGSAQTLDFDITDFSSISFGVPGDLYLTQGSTEKVSVKGSDEAIDQLVIEKKGSRLVIRSKDRNWSWRGFRRSSLTISVTFKDLESLKVSGSGSVFGENKFQLASDLELSVSGSGNMSLEVEARSLEARVSGSGDIEIGGSADQADMRISGSGKVRGDDFKVKSAEASISGSGSCYIEVEEEIVANISGSGNVYYRGDPDRVLSNASGSGRIRKM